MYLMNNNKHQLKKINNIITIMYPYSCCFVGFCHQHLFHTDHSILVQLPLSFLSMHLVRFHMVHRYSSIESITVWKKSIYINREREREREREGERVREREKEKFKSCSILLHIGFSTETW